MAEPYWRHPEYAAQIAGVRELPDCDVRRLVLADWLDDHGEPERAEFIRVGVDRARLMREGHGTGDCPKLIFLRKNRRPGGQMMPTCDLCDDVIGHEIRERELLRADVPHPDGGLRSQWEAWLGVDRVRCPAGDKWFHRGFASRVSGPLAVLHGGECGRCEGRNCRTCSGLGRTPGILADLLAREPLGPEGIEVSDREPMPVRFDEPDDGCLWWDETHQRGNNTLHPQSNLPAAVFRELDGHPLTAGSFYYPTPADARAALSRVLFRLHAPKGVIACV